MSKEKSNKIKSENILPFLELNFTSSDDFNLSNSPSLKILNYFPQSISIKDNNLRYIYANKSTLKRFGLSNEQEIIGKTDTIFFNKNFSDFLTSQELKILETMQPLIDVEFEEHWIDNSVTYALVTKIPIAFSREKANGILTIIVDITKQKEAENALGDNLNFLEVLVNTLPVSIFYTDEKRIFQGCNDDFCNLTMKERHDLIGKSIDDIFSDETSESISKYFESLVTSQKVQTFEIEVEFINKKKVETIIQLANFRNFNNDVVGYIGCIIDIHNQKETERKLEEYAEELKRINASKDKFFSIIAHDLKNPFITLLGLTEALLEDFYEMEDEEILEYISQLRKTSKSTYQLLENLLQWSRSQTGRLKYEPSNLNLFSITEEILSQISSQSLAKKINIANNISPDISALADREMIKTVFRNLITNAIKFTNESGQIFINALLEQNFIKVSVEDTGIGIPPEMLPNMFSIDRNFTTPGTKNEEGTGLGLILCKEFVEKNGGKIWVESNSPKGSTFYFTVPRATVE